MNRIKKALFPLLVMLCIFPAVVSAGQTCLYTSMGATTPSDRFIDNNDGTVSDTKTGLMWQKCAEGISGTFCTSAATGTGFTWQNALLRVRTVNSDKTLAGYSDWRLPNIKELSTLIEEQCHNPSINIMVFPNTGDKGYWSSSSNSNSYAFGIDFTNGNIGNLYKPNQYLIRMVRGGE